MSVVTLSRKEAELGGQEMVWGSVCNQKHLRHYGSVENLLICHCAESLFTWVNKNLNGPKRLLIVNLGGGFARILDLNIWSSSWLLLTTQMARAKNEF